MLFVVLVYCPKFSIQRGFINDIKENEIGLDIGRGTVKYLRRLLKQVKQLFGMDQQECLNKKPMLKRNKRTFRDTK